MRILYIDCFYGFSASKLLGALADIGARVHDIEKGLSQFTSAPSVKVTSVSRSSIDCKTAAVISECGGDDGATWDFLMEKAVLCGIRSVKADYVMCSAVPLADDTDGEVISILGKGGVEAVPSSEAAFTGIAGARLLAALVSESGPKPAMDIISVGYGADAEDKEGFLCVTLGEYNQQDIFMEKQWEYGELV